MTSISQERNGLAAVGWRLRRREEWGARRTYTDARTVIEPATRVFVHITITNPANYSSDDAHARAVEAIGIARFPSTGISYNRLLFRSGAAYEGQPMGRRGAHTVNDFEIGTCTRSGNGCPGRGGPLTAPGDPPNLNYNARAYVICQNVADTVTDAQFVALAKSIAADKLAGFVTRDARIHGHRCVSSKSCPGNLMWARMLELDALVNDYLRTGLPGGEDDMTPEECKTAVREVLAEQRIRLDWDGSDVSFYQALSFIHFNAADGSFVGTVPATSTRASRRGTDTFGKRVLDAVDAVAVEVGLTPEQVQQVITALVSAVGELPPAKVNVAVTVDGEPA